MGKKLSDLEAAEALNNDDLLLIEQGGVAKKILGNVLKALFGSGGSGDVVIDDTLSVSGAAADAAVTGKNIADLGLMYNSMDERLTAVEKAGTSSGVSSWNNLTDRPFGDEALRHTYTYTGTAYANNPGMERLGDAPASIKHLYNAVVTLADGTELEVYPDIFGNDQAVSGVAGAYMAYNTLGWYEIRRASDAELMVMVFMEAYGESFEAGVYCDIHGNGDVDVESIAYTVWTKVEDKYLPDDMSGHLPKTMALTINSATGSFTDVLDDGRTIQGGIVFGETGYPESITYDGLTVPITWEVE